jgi:hypothetical protein
MLDKILIGMILVLVAIAGSQSMYIDHLNNVNQLLKTKIETMERESKQEIERFSVAKDQAETQMQYVKGQTRLILAQDVSPKCDEAIKWGINEAHNFS